MNNYHVIFIIANLIILQLLLFLSKLTVNGIDFSVRQRLDGWYNNLQHPSWGSADSRFIRLSPPAYADGVYQISGEDRPNPYLVSDTLFNGKDGLKNERNLTALFAFFGQVVAYEIMMTNQYSCPIETYNIPVKMCENLTHCHMMDMPFSRAEYDKETGNSPNSPREQINKVTSWIDGSFIYSTKLVWFQALRSWENGTLATSDKGEYPQYNTMGVPSFNLYSPNVNTLKTSETFVLGDPRVNENPALLMFAIVFLRWHNFIASSIRNQHPDWYDEEIFAVTRRWVIATFQNIIAYEYVPALIGESLERYKGYNPDLYPSISHEFQAAAFRYGHSLIPPGFYLRDPRCKFQKFPSKTVAAQTVRNIRQAQAIKKSFIVTGSNVTTQKVNNSPHHQAAKTKSFEKKATSPSPHRVNERPKRQRLHVSHEYSALRLCLTWWDAQRVIEKYGIESMIMGLSSQFAERDDHILISDLRERLFGPRQFSRQDLGVLNIMRGRDKGIPDYNAIRTAIGLPKINKWHDINPHLYKTNPELFEMLSHLYNGDINNVDLYPGGLLESDPIKGPGPTFKKIIKSQFERLRDSDRFWFENTDSGIFSREEIAFIKNIKLYDILVNVTKIPAEAIQQDVFHWIPGDPCQQPKQIETDPNKSDEIEKCGFVQTYDFFEGNQTSYIATTAALALLPAFIGLLAYLLVKQQGQRKKRLLDIVSTFVNVVDLKNKQIDNATEELSAAVKPMQINGSSLNNCTDHHKYDISKKKISKCETRSSIPTNNNVEIVKDQKLMPVEQEVPSSRRKSSAWSCSDFYQTTNCGTRFSTSSLYSNNPSLHKEIIVGYEWLNDNHRRKILIDLSSNTADQRIIILNRKGIRLKTSDLPPKDSIIHLEVNSTGMSGAATSFPPYLVLIKNFDKYDLLLEFNSIETRDLFACVKLVNYAHRIAKNVQVVYTDCNKIFESAQTKEKKQKQLDHFFRKAYSATFKSLAEDIKDSRDSIDSMNDKDGRAENILLTKLNKFEFAEALGMKPTSLFVERMFAVIDRNETGNICFQGFLNLTYVFANGTPEEKLKIIFDMFDVNHRGQISRQEFCTIFRGFIECDRIDDQELEAGLDEMLGRVADVKYKNVITCKDFIDLMAHYDKEWANCGIHLKGAGKLFAKKSEANRHDSFSLDDNSVNVAQNWTSRACGTILAYFEENRQNIFYLIIFYAIVLALFADKMLRFCLLLEHTDLRRVMGAGICITRASANVISFVYCLMLLPVCRHLITKLRETKIKKYVPLDSALAFHKLCAYTGIVMVVIHCGGHLINFYHISTQPLEYLKCLFKEMFFKESNMPPPFVFWIYQTITGSTGIILTIITVIMYVFAHESVRQKAYRYFWNTHKLFVPFYALNMLHGAARLTASPSFHLYLIGPAILYTIDKLISLTRKHLEMSVIKASLLPSDVTKLVLNRPHSFAYKSGQWVQISIPDINPGEYHAFTLTSAPHEDVLSVHIKALGRWTWKVRNLYDPNNLQSSSFPRVYIDGPYGDGNQDWPNYEVVVMFGGGIGVTPYASILKDLVNSFYINKHHMIACKKVYFMWICPSHKSYEWFITLLQEIKEKDVDDMVDLHIFVTQYFNKYDLRTTMLYICDKYFRNITNKSILTGLKASNHFGRPEFEKIFRYIQDKHKTCKKIGIFSCGPNLLTSAIERSCEKINKARFTPPLVSHFENFG